MKVRRIENVTFLFSEVEDSAALWQKNPYGMQKAMSVHDALFRQAINANSGRIFKAFGSSNYAAFESAENALVAAVQIQKTLAQTDWQDFPIQVGLILHSAPCSEHDGEYIGLPVKRAGHILAAVHGGQTLLSQATHNQIKNLPEPGLELHDLGDQRFARPDQSRKNFTN